MGSKIDGQHLQKLNDARHEQQHTEDMRRHGKHRKQIAENEFAPPGKQQGQHGAQHEHAVRQRAEQQTGGGHQEEIHHGMPRHGAIKVYKCPIIHRGCGNRRQHIRSHKAGMVEIEGDKPEDVGEQRIAREAVLDMEEVEP